MPLSRQIIIVYHITIDSSTAGEIILVLVSVSRYFSNQNQVKGLPNIMHRYNTDFQSLLLFMFHSSLLINLITFYLYQSCGLHWKISVAEPVSVFPLLCWLVLHSMTFTMYFNELLA